METKIPIAGYIRVSTTAQVKEGESLATQRSSIEEYAKKEHYKITEIYADEGISGGSVKDRQALLRCLNDGQNGKFKLLIINNLSRFGRNALELLNNHKELKKVGIEIYSIKEKIDFSTKYGNAMLGMFAVMAELEKDIIRERMLENRIAKCRRGIPSAGAKPWGRMYNKVTGEWTVKEGAIELIEKAANDYLNGKPLTEIGKYLGMTTVNLIHVFKVAAGDKTIVQFKGEEPIIFNIPRLLSEKTIQELHERIEFNRRNNRTDIINKYVLSGFVRCEKCLGLMSGRTQRYLVKDSQYHYISYYAHVTKPRSTCENISTIRREPLERAVFETIFSNIVDMPNFEKAIASSLPDEKMIKELERKIDNGKKKLKGIQKDLDLLVESVLKKTLSAETISKKETELNELKNIVNADLERDELQLRSLPDVNTVKQEANIIRRQLLERYSGEKYLHKMTYDQKRELLHWLFDGKDQKGTPYGIYVLKHKDQSVDYYMYGKIQGLRTLKGDDINYQGDDDNYITNKVDKK